MSGHSEIRRGIVVDVDAENVRRIKEAMQPESHSITFRLVVEHAEPTWIATDACMHHHPVIGQGPTVELAGTDLIRNINILASADFAHLDLDSQRAIRRGMMMPGSIESDIARWPADRVFREDVS